MTIEYRIEEGIGVIKIIGDLDAYNVRELTKKFHSYLKETVLFVLDLSELKFLDSTGLGTIINFVKYLSEMDGMLCVVNPQPKPRMVFEITQAYKIIDFYDDIESAIIALQNR